MKIRLRMTDNQLQNVKKMLVAGNIPAATFSESKNFEQTECCMCVSELYEKTHDVPDNRKVLIFKSGKFEERACEVDTLLKREKHNLEYMGVCFVDENDIAGINFSTSKEIDVISIVGRGIKFYIQDRIIKDEEMHIRTSQVFGAATVDLIRKLKIGIVGLSGTGSVVAEQLIRLGVGELVVVDDDIIEEKNLNRIINSKKNDAESRTAKVDMIKQFVDQAGLTTIIFPFKTIVSDTKAIKALAHCDILFGCMDSVDGRHHLNTIATAYLIPYFDVGVKLVADGMGGIEEITTAAHYLEPGCSSLYSRHVYDSEKLTSASLKRENPDEYRARLQEKYIKGAQESSPAVISVNMLAASLVVLEFLARIHLYRDDESYEIETVRMDLTNMRVLLEKETESCPVFKKYFAIGDNNYLLKK